MTTPTSPNGAYRTLPPGVETLREAARLMRERAHAAFVPWHPWSDGDLPLRSTSVEWQEDTLGYLEGEWGEHAASWHPVVALAVADWLDAEAVINATIEHRYGITSFIRFGRDEDGNPAMHLDTMDAALALAHAYLGTAPSGEVPPC